MKKLNLSLFGLMLSGALTINAQVVGDAAIQAPSFDNNSLLFMGTSQAYPQVVVNSDVSSVVWGTDVQPNILRHTNLNSSYIGTTSSDVIATSGNLNSQAQHLQHVVAFDTNSNQYLSVYKHNFDQPLNDDYSIKGKLYNATTFSSTEFNIEGPFTSSSATPSTPSVAVNGNNIFCVAYHTSLTMSSSSKIMVKFVNANTGVVTPTPSAGVKTGLELTFPGAQHPSVAWNETAGVFGIVYTTGSGNNQKIKFVTVDETGAIITAQKDLIADNSIQVQLPKIYADGDHFVVAWRDYRQVTIGAFGPVSGIPSVRLAQVDVTGNTIALNGAAGIYDTDNSLLISNPYMTEVNIYSDLEVITPGEKYAVVWGTQNVVPSIEFSVVEVDPSTSTITSSIAVNLEQNNTNSFSPTLGYDAANSTYVVAYYEYNGTTYENRICQGIECTIDIVATGVDVTTVGGSDGSATTVVSGASGMVTYAWDNGAGTMSSATGLSANTYTVTATDAAGCVATDMVTVSDPVCNLTVTATGVDATTVGGSDGSASTVVSGANGTVSYSWDNGAGTMSSATGLSANTYTVTATDAAGCVATDMVTISDPVCNLSITATGVDATTIGGSDGSATTMVSGANGTVSYSWDNGAGTMSSATGLSAGNYTVTATDAAGCIDTDMVTISDPSCTISITATGTNATSSGASDGTITTNVTGAAGTVTYVWDNGAGNVSSLSGLGAGTYNVIATDASGCSDNASVTIGEDTNIGIEDNNVIQLVLFPNPATDVITLKGNLSNVASYVITDVNGRMISLGAVNGSINEINITDLVSGMYFITITERNNVNTLRFNKK